MMALAFPSGRRYGSPVTVNPVAGFGDPMSLAHKRPNRQQALFLCLPLRVMAAVRGRPSGLPGTKAPVRQPAHSCLHYSFGDGSRQLHFSLGANPMTTRNPSKARASAHRAMALAALRSNSSLAVRLNRYNHHRAIQRSLEAQADACAWLENLEGDAWADACEEIAAALKAKEVSHA